MPDTIHALPLWTSLVLDPRAPGRHRVLPDTRPRRTASRDRQSLGRLPDHQTPLVCQYVTPGLGLAR